MKYILSLLLSVFSLCGFTQGIILETTSENLEVATSTTGDIDYQINWVDIVLASGATPGASEGKITTATTTTVVAAPGSSTYRTIKSANFSNIDATDVNVLTIKKDISATEYVLFTMSLAAGEKLTYSDAVGWQAFTPSGQLKARDTYVATGGEVKFLNKTGTGADATGYWYGHWKDAGIPGAWAPGTPGVNGRTTDGNSTTDAGCIAFPDASGGNARYLTAVQLTGSAIEAYLLADVLWINSGITVTTTTEQTFTTPTWPARDNVGGTNGEGLWIGVYATAALGNAAVVSNSTIRYTNSAGTGSRTATLAAVVGSQFPATPAIGTTVWFQLAAGDIGVRSIQGITLATTLTSGSLSVFVARPIAMIPASVVNQVFETRINNGSGVRIYDDACMLMFYQAANTTSVVTSASIMSALK